MDFHLCKSRRGSNPEAVVSCNNPGTGSVTPGTQNNLDPADVCPSSPLSIHICPTTGGLFQMDIAPNETVEGLKRTVAKKLGVSQDRIKLLHKDRLLKEGSLKANQLSDGCRITLLPHVETGLVSPHPEVTVMQALENLSESQVNDFLAGKSPLTLAMKLGKHMMFLQLQLSTVPHGVKRSHVPKASSSRPVRLPHNRSPNTLTVPSSQPASMATKAHPGNMLRTPSPSQPPSIVTPPPSPRSPSSSSSSNSPYTYPITSFPTVTSPNGVTSNNDIAFDPTNTPPPSPCYIHKPIPTVPSVRTSQEYCHRTSDTPTNEPKTLSYPPGDNSPTPGAPFLDSSTLAAAKRSLSMKLKEISKQKARETNATGAVIETMQRLGHGVYSGTFSGSLNPALQDTDGKPRKSISTIVHILNDLLGASHSRIGEQTRILVPQHHHQQQQQQQQPQQQQQQPQSQRLARESHTAMVSPDNAKTHTDQTEHQDIRGKVEKLQMRLEERRLMRQARRKARGAPYPTGHTRSPGDHVTHDVMDYDVSSDNEAARDLNQGSADETMPI